MLFASLGRKLHTKIDMRLIPKERIEFAFN